MSGIDEKQMMLAVLEEVAGVTSLPLAIDSSHVDVLEAALRRYPGRALINSISYEKAKLESLLPLAKKYGAMFILLPLSDKGLPKDLDERKEIIHKIADKAQELGMDKRDETASIICFSSMPLIPTLISKIPAPQASCSFANCRTISKSPSRSVD